jgi:hypothetical protein
MKTTDGLVRRLNWLLDSALLLLEEAIERVGDHHRVRSLQVALRQSEVLRHELRVENERLEADLRLRDEQRRLKRHSDDCWCGLTFRTTKDWRDHLPCDGPR